MDRRSEQKKLTSSHLFTVRIWCEWVGENRQEWRGQVEQVLGGKIGYFRNWSMLIDFFKESLAALEPDHPAGHRENDSGQNPDVDQV